MTSKETGSVAVRLSGLVPATGTEMQQSQAACTVARVAADAQSASAEARGRDTGQPPAPDAGLLAGALAQLAAESAARAAAEVRAERAEARASRAESRLREVITDTTLEVQRLGQQLQAAFAKIAELRDLLPDMCGAASEARTADQGSPAPVATSGHAPARADTPAAHTQPRQEQGAAEPQCSPHLRQQQHRMQQGGPSHAAAAGIPAASPPAALSHAPPAAPETPALAAASPCPKPEPQEHLTGPQHQAAVGQQHHVAAAGFGSKSGSQAPVVRLSAKILPPLPEATAAKAAPDSPGAQAGLQYIAAAAAAVGQAAAPAPASAGGAGGVAGSRLRVRQAPSGGWRPVTGMMLHQALAGAAGASAALAADGPHPQQLVAASGPAATPPEAVVAAALQAAAVAPAAQVAAAVAAPAAGPTAVPAGRSVAQAVESLMPVRLAWSGGPQHGPPDGLPGSLWELQQRLAAVAAGGGGGALDLDFGGAELPPGPKPLPGTGALRIACGVPVMLRNAVLPACVVVEGCPRAALVNVTCRPGPGRWLLTGGGSQVVMEAVVTGLGAGTLVTMSGCFVEVKAAGGGGGAAASAGVAAVAAAVAAAEVAAGAGSAAAVAGAAAAAGGAAASPALASSPDGLLHSCVGVLVEHGAGAVLEGCAVVGPHPRDVQLQGGGAVQETMGVAARGAGSRVYSRRVNVRDCAHGFQACSSSACVAVDCRAEDCVNGLCVATGGRMWCGSRSSCESYAAAVPDSPVAAALAAFAACGDSRHSSNSIRNNSGCRVVGALANGFTAGGPGSLLEVLGGCGSKHTAGPSCMVKDGAEMRVSGFRSDMDDHGFLATDAGTLLELGGGCLVQKAVHRGVDVQDQARIVIKQGQGAGQHGGPGRQEKDWDVKVDGCGDVGFLANGGTLELGAGTRVMAQGCGDDGFTSSSGGLLDATAAEACFARACGGYGFCAEDVGSRILLGKHVCRAEGQRERAMVQKNGGVVKGMLEVSDVRA